MQALYGRFPKWEVVISKFKCSHLQSLELLKLMLRDDFETRALNKYDSAA